MEEDCECLFCHRDDLNLYEINQNSILIGPELVDFTEIIFEIFNAHPNSEIINYICEECKDLVTQFYIFKKDAKKSLIGSPVFDKLKKFLLDSTSTAEPIVKCSPGQFIVSFVAIDEPKIQYSVVKPIVKFKANQENLKKEKAIIQEVYPEEEDLGIKYTEVNEGEVEEVQEEEVYAVESIVEADDDEDTENYFEEDAEVKTEPEESEKIEIMTEKVFQCECGSLFPTSTELKTHMQTHSNKRKAPSSEICCNVAFKDYKCFQMHQKAHENFDVIVAHMPTHICNDCNFMFSNEDDFMTHLEKHPEVRDFVVPRRGAYEDHFIRNVSDEYLDYNEDNPDFFTCGHCKKRANEHEMKLHLLFFHTTTVFCPLDTRCFEGAKHVRLFSDHIRNKHPEIFEKSFLYSCRHCSQSFNTCFEKLAHMKLCNAKPFECRDHCNKRFASEWLLKNHMKTVNGDDRFACEMCGKKCVSRSDLQIHERMHTNERPYPCPICHKKFKTSANRSSHMDIHEVEKKHECPICGEKFQTRPILRKHKKVHDEKYQEECMCKICERKYVTKQHLLRHLKSSHGLSSELGSDDIGKFFADYFETN